MTQSPIFSAKTGGIVGWVDEPDETPPTPEEQLAAWREIARCTPLQGILTLGETEWQKVTDYRDNHATWAQRVIIDSAHDWRRNSQDIAFFQWLLEYTDEQVDDLFIAAMQVEV